MAVLKNEGKVSRSALIPNNPFNLDRVFVKEGNQPRMFSARSNESSRPVNACRFVLVFLHGGEAEIDVTAPRLTKLRH